MGRSRMLVLAASFALVVCGGLLKADDHESPVFPPPDAYSGTAPVGDVVVAPIAPDTSVVDLRQALEAQLTALLVLGDVTATSEPVSAAAIVGAE
jgi:hypothetical protein